MEKVGGLFNLLVIFFIGLILGRATPIESREEPPTERVDTLYVHDTIASYKPIYCERWVVDTILVPVVDSVLIRDTLFVMLEKEQVMWRDSLCEVYASGIRPEIDSVFHFTCDKIVTIERVQEVKVKSRWGLGVQAGAGVSREGLSPYVGVGISYNLISW